MSFPTDQKTDQPRVDVAKKDADGLTSFAFVMGTLLMVMGVIASSDLNNRADEALILGVFCFWGLILVIVICARMIAGAILRTRSPGLVESQTRAVGKGKTEE